VFVLGLWLDCALSPNKTREVKKLMRKKIEFFPAVRDFALFNILNLLFDDWILLKVEAFTHLLC